MRKKNGKRVIIIHLFHLTTTVKEKKRRKYEKENGKIVIIFLFNLMATVKEKRKENMRKKTVKA